MRREITPVILSLSNLRWPWQRRIRGNDRITRSLRGRPHSVSISPLAGSPTSLPINLAIESNRRPLSHLLEALPGISLRRAAAKLGRRLHHGPQVNVNFARHACRQFGISFRVTPSSFRASITKWKTVFRFLVRASAVATICRHTAVSGVPEISRSGV